MKNKIIITVILVGLVVAGRLMPHVWNVTPVIAVSLLAGYVLPRKWAVVVPLIAMFIADLSLGFYHVPVMLTVYGSLALTTFLGAWIKKIKPHRILAASLASSTFFFLTTNFAVWASGTWYPKTAAGLLLAYEMGLPFFRNMALGDLIFTGVMFGAWVIVGKLGMILCVIPAQVGIQTKAFLDSGSRSE